MLVSRFLVERLENAGVKHIFGLPGEYVFDLYKELWDNKCIQVVNNTDELFSCYAADAYARVKGVGCVIVAHSAGASKIINAVQCAYAERSPIVVIAGIPGADDGIVFSSQKKIFDDITCASVVLDNPSTAGYLIDHAFEAMHHFKRPIYIELPRDVSKKPISYDVYKQGTPVRPKTNPDSLDEALAEVCDRLLHAERPAILAGVELGRCDLGDKLIRFAERFNIPVATTLLSKSVISERHPLFMGIYFGSGSDEVTRKVVEEADCLLLFGVMIADAIGSKLPKFSNKWLISASLEGLRIRNHAYTNVQFVDFCESLFRTSEIVIPKKPDVFGSRSVNKVIFEPQPDAEITRSRLFQKINSIISKNIAIVSDMGDALVGASQLTVHDRHNFLSPAFYNTLGWSIPAAIGVQTARQDVRPIVLLGDAAFQVSCAELSTILDRKLDPIIFVLNNDGYTTERMLIDGDFNKLRKWQYHKYCELFDGGEGRYVETEQQLEKVVTEAIDLKRVFVINVKLKRMDASDRLKQFNKEKS